MKDSQILVFQQKLSEINVDDVDFLDPKDKEELEELNSKIELVQLKIIVVELKVKDLTQYSNYIKFDHEYYLTLDDAIWEQKERKKFLLEDLNALILKKERFKKKNSSKIIKKIEDCLLQSDNLFFFFEN